MISSELFLPQGFPSPRSFALSPSSSPILLPTATANISPESSFLPSFSTQPFVYSYPFSEKFMLMSMMMNGSVNVSAESPSELHPAPSKAAQPIQNSQLMNKLLGTSNSSNSISIELPLHRPNHSHNNHSTNGELGLSQGGILYHHQLQQQHYPQQPHQHILPSFNPKTPSPSPGSAGAVYLENEKSVSPPPIGYSSHIQSDGVWYQANIPHHPHHQMTSCIQSTSISPSSYQEGYPGSFIYHQQAADIIDPNTLYRPIQISPSVLSSQQIMTSSGKRCDTFSSITMKLKKKRESHNAVERRRRDNINERIQFLCSIVPECKRRQIKASILAADETKKASFSTSQLKLNKSFILQKATEYIEALSDYVEKQSSLIKNLIPCYTGGLDELNTSLLDSSEIDYNADTSEDMHESGVENGIEDSFPDKLKGSLTPDMSTKEIIAQDVVAAQF